MGNYIPLEDIQAINSEDDAGRYWTTPGKKTITRKNQIPFVNKMVEFEYFRGIESMAKNVKYTPAAKAIILKYPKLIKYTVSSDGMKNFIAQLTFDEIKQLIDSLLTTYGEFDSIWTSFYQKTLGYDAFKNNAKRTQTILQYLIIDKKIRFFADSKILSNIIEKMTDMTPEFVDWINENGGDRTKIFMNFIKRNGSKMSAEALSYMYHNANVDDFILWNIADAMLEVDPNNEILYIHFEKTKVDRFMPQKVKNIFVF